MAAARESAARKKRPRGRPTRFRTEIGDRIVERIRTGTPPTVAAQAEGVSPATFHDWTKRGKTAKASPALRAFSEAVTRSRAQFESETAENITRAATNGEWRAGAWHLERQFRARYAAAIKVVRDDEARFLLEIAESVLAGEDYERLLAALAAANSARDSGETEGQGSPFD